MKSLAEIRNLNSSTHKSKSIKSTLLYRYSIPFSQPLLFNKRWLTHRDGFIVELIFTDGSKGYGEAAPLKGFSRESLAECEQLLHTALKQLITGNIVNILPSAAKFAIDCALEKIPYQFQSQHCANIPLLVGTTSSILAKYRTLHCPKRVKLKVARNSIDDDVKNIEALCAMNENITFNLDANRAWSIKQATAFSKKVPIQSINYIEEPCHSLEQSLIFSQQTGVHIALDESLQAADFNFLPYITNRAIKALIIKPSIIGGFEPCLQFIEQAKKAGIACSLSSSYESSFGISQLQYLANKWTPTQPSGFDTLESLTFDIISDSTRNAPVLQLNDLELICQY